MGEDYKKRYRIILVLFIIACLIIFSYIIYSQVYKSKIQEAYNQGQLDMSIFITQQIWEDKSCGFSLRQPDYKVVREIACKIGGPIVVIYIGMLEPTRIRRESHPDAVTVEPREVAASVYFRPLVIDSPRFPRPIYQAVRIGGEVVLRPRRGTDQ